MLESAWLFVGFVALLASGLALATSDDAVGIVAGTIGLLSWVLWAYGSLNVESADGSGAFSMPALTLLGLAFAIVPAYIALTGPVEVVGRARNAGTDDL